MRLPEWRRDSTYWLKLPAVVPPMSTFNVPLAPCKYVPVSFSTPGESPGWTMPPVFETFPVIAGGEDGLMPSNTAAAYVAEKGLLPQQPTVFLPGECGQRTRMGFCALTAEFAYDFAR